MDTLKKLIAPETTESSVTPQQRRAATAAFARLTGADVYEPSLAPARGTVLALVAEGPAKRLVIIGPDTRLGPLGALASACRSVDVGGLGCTIAFIETSPAAAEELRLVLPWTAPSLQGLQCSVGLGDRRGLATPGHLRAVAHSGVSPYFAQQSIREMTRTQRTADQVMSDASWGVFQAGWRHGFGSDADHLKTTDDIDLCARVGFTMFTIDPGDHVRNEADEMDAAALAAAAAEAPWDLLETTLSDVIAAYAGKTIALDGGDPLTFDQPAVLRAIVKYGGAIAHTTAMYRHLKTRMSDTPFELEVSVDETATPTTEPEHYLIAAELKRLGVEWIGLAPRFIGEFEKGIDYKGDRAAFERSFAQHAAIARTLGPYKLSIHSGSDKFSVYPIAARLANRLVHLKTAGTSYLEALRVVGRKNPDLFRRILEFAFSRFDEERKTYHISADLSAIRRADDLKDDQLETTLDGNDGRQLLHVTFGSVLTTRGDDGAYLFRNDLLNVLRNNEDEHYDVLAAHLGRHIEPFKA
jgi:hypothetical protein